MKLQIGEKIKALRLASDLTQEELANRARLTRGFISQIENDQSSINLDSLVDILDALRTTTTMFFSDKSSPQVVFKQHDRIAIEGEGISIFEILVPGSTNNVMNPMLLKLKPGEKLKIMEPMPGEQFGYVLKGTITLKINNQVKNVSSSNCFYFESNKQNQIINMSNKSAELLWVTSPPHM